MSKSFYTWVLSVGERIQRFALYRLELLRTAGKNPYASDSLGRLVPFKPHAAKKGSHK